MILTKGDKSNRWSGDFGTFHKPKSYYELSKNAKL